MELRIENIENIESHWAGGLKIKGEFTIKLNPLEPLTRTTLIRDLRKLGCSLDDISKIAEEFFKAGVLD